MKTSSIKYVGAIAFSVLSLNAFASDASESCTSEPKSKWLQDTEVRAKFEKEGYTIERVKVEGSCYELRTVDDKGRETELVVNPVDAKLVKKEGDS